MYKINKEGIIEALSLRRSGVKGWYSGICPFCGSIDKFGIILNETGISSYNCFRGSCGEKGTLFKLLRKINRLDLLEREEVLIDNKITKTLISSEKQLDYSTPVKSLPLGFKRVEYDPYLEGRGFIKEQYDLFHVGVALIEPRLKNNYIVFLQYQDGECKGYLARSKKSKEWHKRNEERHKAGLERLFLRYDNSPNTDFEKLLGGCDEILPGKTDTVIIVEGLMDKANTDVKLDLYTQDFMKCCYTYGNKVTDYQIKILQDKGVENIILLYDYNTIKQTKQYGQELDKYFNTKIGEITIPEVDPGVMSIEQFLNVFQNLKDPTNFSINRVAKKVLK